MLSFKLLSLVFILGFWPNISLGGQAPKTTGIYKIEEIGEIVQSATLEHRLRFHLLQTDQTHLLLYYVLTDCGKQPFQILDVNLSTGQVRVADAVLGRPGPIATILHSNGLIYLGSGAPGYFMVYDPETGQTRKIEKLADNGAQYIIEGDDGAIYIGECTKGYVERYDPKTQAWDNYGIIDDPGPPYYRYAYTLGADGRYIYVAIGQRPWYLVIFDRQDRTSRVYWKESGATYVGVSRGKDRSWYAQCSTKEGKRWYRLTGGREPELLSRAPEIMATNMIRQGELPKNFDIDLERATPDSSNGGQVVVRWRQKGSEAWREATAKLRIGPIEIKRLYPLDDKRLLGFTSFYGPMFTYEPDTKQTTILGRPQRSLYDALFAAGRWWLAGYPAATIVYDPARPWTLTASTQDLFSSLVNPHLLHLPGDGTAKYHYYLAAGADGCIYVGGHRERDSVGGTLGWYHPQTKLTGGLREPFLKYDVRDLISTNGGASIIFSGIGIEKGSDGKIFVFDVRQKKIIKEIIPLPGSNDAGKLQEAGAGKIIGVVRGDAKSLVYKLDLSTGTVEFTKEIAGKAFGGIRSYDRRLVKGPDGFIWLYVDNAICRINPADGGLEKILEAPPSGNLLFFRNDLYLYGDANLRRVKGIFKSSD